MKKRIIDGELGEIVHICMRKPHRLSAAGRPEWFFSKEKSGGIVNDLFINDFDLLRWLTGKEIVGTQGYRAKHILPEYPTFYDLTSLHVMLEDQLVATLYTDWHTAEGSWTWGDGRIFVVGTKGTVELRLEGDPLVSNQSLLLLTCKHPLEQAEFEKMTVSLTKDFLDRINGQEAIVTH